MILYCSALSPLQETQRGKESGKKAESESDDEKIAVIGARCLAPRKARRVLNKAMLMRFEKITQWVF